MTLWTILENKNARCIIKTTSFYVLSFILLSVLEKWSPSGPCVPGLGMFGFLLLIPVCFVLFLINLYQAVEKDKAYLYSAGIHLLVWGWFIISNMI